MPRFSPASTRTRDRTSRKLFTQKYDELVLVKDIRFESFCEHHLLPFIGSAHVAYIPNGRVVGLSKIPRVIDALAKRPQLQERLTEEVADLLMSELQAKGRRRGDRSVAQLHDDPRGPQAGQFHGHQRPPGSLQGPGGDPG